MAPGGSLADKNAARRRSEQAAMTPFGQAIDRRISELRSHDPSLTKERVAALTGISRQHLWRALRGMTRLSDFEVAQLARVLELDPDIVSAAYMDIPENTLLNADEIDDFIRQQLPNVSQVSADDPIGRPLSLAEAAAILARARKRGWRPRDEREADFVGQTPDGRYYVVETKPGLPGEVREVGRGLPHELQIMAEEFKLDALRAGADERERTFIASVLGSPEAIFRQSGYRDHNLTADQQRAELESVIAMLREWLRMHMAQRAAAERAGVHGADE